MAYPTIESITNGIVTRLQTVSGLRTNNVRPLAIQAMPIAFVGPPLSIQYHGTMGHGKVPMDFTVTVVVSKTIDRVGQVPLMGFMDLSGATSIHAAIEADRTLGGKVDDCVVDDATFDEAIDIGGVEYYGAVFSLRVVAPGI